MAKKRKIPATKKRAKRYSNLDSLKPEKNTKVRREFIDYDYLKTLPPDDKEWLAKFNNEYYGAAVSKTDTGRVKPGHLHTKKAQAKEIYDDNNRRNNDVLGVSRVNVGLTEINAELDSRDGWYITRPDLQEDAVLTEIDRKAVEDDFLSYEEYLELRGNMTLEMLMLYESIYGDYKD
jgi:hypothetical protein